MFMATFSANSSVIPSFLWRDIPTHISLSSSFSNPRYWNGWMPSHAQIDLFLSRFAERKGNNSGKATTWSLRGPATRRTVQWTPLTTWNTSTLTPRTRFLRENIGLSKPLAYISVRQQFKRHFAAVGISQHLEKRFCWNGVATVAALSCVPKRLTHRHGWWRLAQARVYIRETEEAAGHVCSQKYGILEAGPNEEPEQEH